MTTTLTGERADFLESLRRHRGFLRQTADGLSEDQARTASTVSVLTIAALIKHVADTEEQWIAFATGAPEAMGGGEDWSDGGEWDPDAPDPRFVLTDAETLPVLLARYDEVAAATDTVVASGDLDRATPLPSAPWFEPGAVWTLRRTLLHVIAETSQHAGHADIIREAIDGAKTMG